MTYRLILMMAVIAAVILGFIGLVASAATAGPPAGPIGPVGVPVVDSEPAYAQLYQGKTILWWANKAHQARKDANARRTTIQRLKKTIRYSASIEECVKLATIAYPALSEDRAWRIIRHESWTSGKQFAKNKTSTASGLYQFLTSTFASTPYGRAGMSIWSPCASSLAAGWMHQNGRGGEWAIR